MAKAIFSALSVAFAFLASIGDPAYAGDAGSIAASTGFNPIAPLGTQSWIIDGSARNIDSTYYLDLPAGFQFTIEVPVDSVPADQTSAVEAAWPYIRHAYVSKVYSRTIVNKAGTGHMAPDRIGVALVTHQGQRTTGNRVAMTFSEIRARLDREDTGKYRGGQHP